MASIYEAVRVIIVYLLFSSVLLGILQESQYKPYVRLFTSLLLVLLLVRVFSFASLNLDIEHMLEQAVLADDFSKRLEKAQEAGKDKIQEQLIEEIRKKADIFLEEYGYEIEEMEVILTKDYQIEKMELKLEWKEKKENNKENSNKNNNIDTKELKEVVAEYFSINPENIAIKILGGIAYGQMDRRTW